MQHRLIAALNVDIQRQLVALVHIKPYPSRVFLMPGSEGGGEGGGEAEAESARGP